jgi:hypothetical protein
MAEAKFVPLLTDALDAFRERPARAVFGLLVLLWTVLLLVLVVAPVAAVSFFFLRSIPFLGIALSGSVGVAAALYFGARSFYTHQKLYATGDGFFEAWAESGPNRSRTVTAAGLTFIVVFVGFICLIIPGVYLFLGLSLVPSLLVLEKLEGLDTFKASWAMMQGWKLRLFLWSLAYFGVCFLVQMALNVVPILGPLASMVISIFFTTPLWTLFLIAFYRALKTNPPKPETNWKALLLALVAVLALLAAAGFWAYHERSKILGFALDRAFARPGGAGFQSDVYVAEGETLAGNFSGHFGPLAPQPPFASAWTGVLPGPIAVGVSGTVAVGAVTFLSTFDYAMAQGATRTSATDWCLGLASDASSNLYLLCEIQGQTSQTVERLGPDLSTQFSWSVTGDGLGRPQGNPIAAAGANLWQATGGDPKTIKLYDPQGQILKQGRWTSKDPGKLFGLSLAADQVGGLYLLADSIDTHAKPYVVARHLYFMNNVPNDPAAEVPFAWDAALPVQPGDGYGLVAVTWEGIPYVADRHGLTALPGGVAAHNWAFDLDAPLRGFAIDPWGAAHFLDGKTRMQRMASVAY